MRFFFVSLRRRRFFSYCILTLCICFSACELRFGAIPTPTLTPTTPPKPILTVVWVQDGDLFAWREDKPTALKIASSGVIQPFLAPDGRHVAFTRGSQDSATSLWEVGSDGVEAQQLVKPDALKSLRSGHPQINEIRWLDAQTIYFNTLQHYDTGDVNDDDLYRVALDGSDPLLILPPGSGGEFALSPDGQQIAVIRAGIYDTQKGQLALLDPLGATVQQKLTFTALRATSEAPFYPPLWWSDDSSFVRVPIPSRDNDRVALWRVPVAGDAAIFGYISADQTAFPVWSKDQLLYHYDGALMIADANGENSQVYANVQYALPEWLPDGAHFTYYLDGDHWAGKRGEAPRKLNIPGVRMIFAGGDTFVYAAADGIRYAHLNQPGSTLIQGFEAVPYFDAVVAP